jgi:hypothetical protein
MFDWRLYQNDQLVEEYLSLNVLNNIYKVDDNLSYSHDNKTVLKKTEDYSIIIDLNNGKMIINLDSDKLNGELSLFKYEVSNNDNEIILLYQTSEEEPINKIIISRRQ